MTFVTLELTTYFIPLFSLAPENLIKCIFFSVTHSDSATGTTNRTHEINNNVNTVTCC